MNQELTNKLLEAALQAREKSYAPYSGFAVGAALLTDDGIFSKFSISFHCFRTEFFCNEFNFIIISCYNNIINIIGCICHFYCMCNKWFIS